MNRGKTVEGKTKKSERSFGFPESIFPNPEERSIRGWIEEKEEREVGKKTKEATRNRGHEEEEKGGVN